MVSLKKEQKQFEAALPSGERNRNQERVSARLKGLNTLKNRIISGIEDAQRKSDNQKKTFDEYRNKVSAIAKGKKNRRNSLAFRDFIKEKSIRFTPLNYQSHRVKPNLLELV